MNMNISDYEDKLSRGLAKNLISYLKENFASNPNLSFSVSIVYTLRLIADPEKNKNSPVQVIGYIFGDDKDKSIDSITFEVPCENCFDIQSELDSERIGNMVNIIVMGGNQ